MLYNYYEIYSWWEIFRIVKAFLLQEFSFQGKVIRNSFSVILRPSRETGSWGNT